MQSNNWTGSTRLQIMDDKSYVELLRSTDSWVTYSSIGILATKDDLSVKIITSGSVFSLPDGRYYCTPAVSNMPNSSYGYVEVATWGDEKMIKVYDLKANANIYLNMYANGTWAGWTVK